MLNDRTTSEMECPSRLAPTIMPRSNSDNSHRLASVQPDSRENTSHMILLWAFPRRQGMVAPLKNKFTYGYPMTFGTWTQFWKQFHIDQPFILPIWTSVIPCQLEQN
jgi:hypothetical protein